MSKSDSLENGWLLLLFNAVTYANVAANAGASPLTSLYVAAHTADPGEGGAQTASEISYTGYSRVGIVRTSSGWTVTGSSVAPVTNPVVLGKCTAGSGTLTHFSVGELSTGAGRIFYSGPVTPNIAVVAGVTPKLDIVITED